MSKRYAIWLAPVMMSSIVCAQDPTRPVTPTNPTTPSTTPSTTPTTVPSMRMASETNDSVLLTWLIVDNENEIALSRIALQRATNPEVKQFAQQMIDDHTKMVQKLQQASATAKVGQLDRTTGRDPSRADNPVGRTDPARTDPARTDPTRTDPSGRTDPTRTDPTRNDPLGARPADASGVRTLGNLGGLDHERLIRDLGRQCLQSHTQILQEKQGAEFDKCFMGMQVGAHVKAVDTLTVFQNYASDALRPTLAEGLTTVQSHLQHAKDLAKRTETASR
jgi:predicted outer membrane protein